ncbi:hypothetical protein [Umezawaea tangerina]|uniref:Uncharacterized protein n=1 Tax=Umezawaea tangerina TaxID=84725 RepID=A0A2T0SPM5_9PSEU|nr:hypothetical protein [Umezawaea tangerina]PRY35360.1 hypothetical protein CLV43_114278 [Umezawaea tangerina]
MSALAWLAAGVAAHDSGFDTCVRDPSSREEWARCREHLHLLDDTGAQLPACRSCCSPWVSPDEHECGPGWCAVDEIPDGVHMPDVPEPTHPGASWEEISEAVAERMTRMIVEVLPDVEFVFVDQPLAPRPPSMLPAYLRHLDLLYRGLHRDQALLRYVRVT